MKIDSFQGEYRFLSNFWPAKVTMYGVEYPSVENAYQAAKEVNPAHRAKYVNVTPGQSKRMGRKAYLRPDWEKVKLSVMEELVRRKFAIPYLRKKLKDTGDAELIEGNEWGDTFWGICQSTGCNHLGRILMKIRSEIN